MFWSPAVMTVSCSAVASDVLAINIMAVNARLLAFMRLSSL
jgi:hypothetical protein